MIKKLKKFFCKILCLAMALLILHNTNAVYVITKDAFGEYQKVEFKRTVLTKFGIMARGVKSILTIKLITPEKKIKDITHTMLAFDFDTDNFTEAKMLVSFIIDKHPDLFNIKYIYIPDKNGHTPDFFDIAIYWL